MSAKPDHESASVAVDESDAATGSSADWAGFVTAFSDGNYEQTQAWARIRSGLGWDVRRICLRVDGRLIAGFQVYSRRVARLWKMAYVPKAPVLESGDRCDAALDQLLAFARRERIDLLVAQPPEGQTAAIPRMRDRGFFLNRLFGIISANLVIDLTRGFDAVQAGMSPHTRQEARQGLKRGLTVREGGAGDLPVFFELMAGSCRRQMTTPNPASLRQLEDVWEAMSPRDAIHLLLVEAEGQPIGGVLIVTEGRRATFWKKGWTDSHNRLRPNQLLFYEGIRWACEKGFASCDFAGMNRTLAERLVNGQPWDDLKKSRDVFNLRYGGTPVLLPEAMIWIRNPVMRTLYRIVGPAAPASLMRGLRRMLDRRPR